MGRVDTLNIGLGALSGALILVMVIVVSVDSIIRKVFSITIPGATEFNTLLLVILIYCGLAGAQARFAHFTVQAVTGLLPRQAARIVFGFTTLLSLFFTGVLCWLTGVQAWHSFVQGEISFGIIAFPIWPSRIAIAGGLFLLSLQLVVQFVRLVLDEEGSLPDPNAPELGA